MIMSRSQKLDRMIILEQPEDSTGHMQEEQCPSNEVFEIFFFQSEREKARSDCIFLVWNQGSRGQWSKSSFYSPLSQCPVALLKPRFPLATTDNVLMESTDPNFTIVCWQQDQPSLLCGSLGQPHPVQFSTAVLLHFHVRISCCLFRTDAFSAFNTPCAFPYSPHRL